MCKVVTEPAPTIGPVVGNWLACYGILAWRVSAPQTWVYILNNSLIAIADVPANYVIGTIIPGQGEIDGYMTKDVSGAFGGPSDGNVFVGDGRAWFTLGDVPISVIPPGYSLSVQPWSTFAGSPSEGSTCSFLWGYYLGSKLPKLSDVKPTPAPPPAPTYPQ